MQAPSLIKRDGCRCRSMLRLPHKVVVPDVVLVELENGCDRGRTDFERVKLLIANEVIVLRRWTSPDFKRSKN